MGEKPKRQPTSETPLRGESAWRAHLEAVAKRNEQARRAGAQQRQEREERQAAERRTAELRELQSLPKRNKP